MPIFTPSGNLKPSSSFFKYFYFILYIGEIEALKKDFFFALKKRKERSYWSIHSSMTDHRVKGATEEIKIGMTDLHYVGPDGS